MAVNDFDAHITNVGNAIEAFKEARKELAELLQTHTHNGYSGLISTDYDGRAVTKVQYDNAFTSINDLLNTWLPAGHGTNLDGYLYETP